MTLARVAVAVCSEHHDDPPSRDFTDGRECVEERIGAVTEVDVYGGAGVAGHALGAAGKICNNAVLNGLADGVKLEPGLDQHDDGNGGVCGHMPADDRNAGDKQSVFWPGERKLCV